MVPRVGAITVGGLTGLLVAARSNCTIKIMKNLWQLIKLIEGFFKKTFYGTTGALIATAICYPKEAKEISNVAITKIRTDGFSVVKEQTGKLYLLN